MCYRFSLLFVAIYICVYIHVTFCGFITFVLVFLFFAIHKCYSLLTIVDVISSEVVIVYRRTVVYCLHTPVVTIWSMRVVRATKVRYKGEPTSPPPIDSKRLANWPGFQPWCW